MKLLCLFVFLMACAPVVLDEPDAKPSSDASALHDAPAMERDTSMPPGVVTIACQDMPELHYTHLDGTVQVKYVTRYADLGYEYPQGTVEVCGLDPTNLLSVSVCESPVTQACWVSTGPWPLQSCRPAHYIQDTSGRYWVTCGYRQQRDDNGDGVFETETNWNWNAYIRITP